jgi:hypothetical protein
MLIRIRFRIQIIHFDADFYLMRIRMRIQVNKKMRIRIHNTATYILHISGPKGADEVAEGVETVDFPEDDNEGEEGEGEDEKMEPDNITLLNPGEEEGEMEGMQVEGEETDQLQIDEGKMPSRGLSRVYSVKGFP